MKFNQILTIGFLLFIGLSGQAQNLKRNTVFAHVGAGKINSNMIGNSFEFGYSSHLFSGLYGIATYSKYSASRSVSDILDGEITGSEQNELGIHIFINATNGGRGGSGDFDLEGTSGELMSIRSFALGIKKYIKMGENLRLGGSLLASFSKVSHHYIDGVVYDENDVLASELLFPTYEIFNTIGGKVELELSYFIADHLSFGLSAIYNSSPQIVMLRLGAHSWF